MATTKTGTTEKEIGNDEKETGSNKNHSSSLSNSTSDDIEKNFGTIEQTPRVPETAEETNFESGFATNGMPKGWTTMRNLKKRDMSAKSEPARSRADSNEGLAKSQTNATAQSVEAGTIDYMEDLTELNSGDDLLAEEHAGERHGGGARIRGTDGAADERFGSGSAEGHEGAREFKVYKRRWFGLVQLVLLNIIVSWDWLTFSASSTTVSEYYAVSESTVNWLSTAFLFAFVFISPFTVYVLHHGGPKPAIIISSVLILLGNWIRYGATRAGPHGNFGGVMFGQILTGIAQPFVLAAPTRYSDLWFTNNGRVAATAVMSLANPLGGALAQLIDPLWAGSVGNIPNMVLYIAIISSVATIPSFFIPAAPPTPCSASSEEVKQPLGTSLRFLFRSPEFYMIFIPFSFYTALFNSISSLINQMVAPYSFSETEAGIAGALLIVVGLVTSAVTSPLIDRSKSFLLAIKIQVPIIAACYLAFTWAPQTRSVGAIYAILSILGAASFSLVPVGLEYLIEITHPVSPEVSSTLCWSGGQLFGGIFIIASDALKATGKSDGSADDGSDRPPGNMYNALVLQTVLALVVVPLPLALGCCGRGRGIRMRRLEADKEARRRNTVSTEGTA